MEIKCPNATFIQPISNEDFARRGLNGKRAAAARESRYEGHGQLPSSHCTVTPGHARTTGTGAPR